MSKIAIAIAAALLVAAGAPVQAQTYPTREIRLIVGLPAGSGGDINARYYADKLSHLAGKPVIVENRPGMILSIGADAVAKAPPDGHTVLITSVTSSHAANVFNFKRLPYDPIKDFTPVAMLQRSYFILMVRPDAPWASVAELTAAMRIKGDKASYGYGAPPALASAELYKARSGLTAVGIPYKSSVSSLSEMLGGEIDFQFIDFDRGHAAAGGRQAAWPCRHVQPARGRCRSSDHGRSRRHSGVRHRAGVGRAAAGWGARANRRAPGILVRRDQPDGRHPAVSRRDPCRAVRGRRQGLAGVHSEGDREVASAGPARQDRAAVTVRQKWYGASRMT